ncbi:hypothetical protein [Pimelobacter simplex]|uniref:hypothetical protein n=1 Tax=Nocardioides simplex TaxID=2045 RepID=UPI003AABF3CC
MRRVLSFGSGLLGGALLAGTAVVVLAALVRPALAAVEGASSPLVAVLVGVLALREIGLLTFRLPENRRLVPETVFRLGDFFGPFQFGLEMGSGVRTYVSSSLPYMLLLVGLWSGRPADLWVAAVGFAAGRYVTTLLSVASGEASRWDASYRAQVRLHRAGLTAFLVTTVVLLVYGS